MYDIGKTCQQHKVGSNLAQRQHISDEGLVSRLTPFLAHELQQSSMFSTRRTFQDFLANIHQTSVRDQASDQDLSYPMLLRTHILPCLAGDWVRVVAPQKAMKTEKSRRSFILIQDARLWGIWWNAIGLYKDSRVSVLQRVSQVLQELPPPPSDVLWSCHKWNLFSLHTRYCWLIFTPQFLASDF